MCQNSWFCPCTPDEDIEESYGWTGEPEECPCGCQGRAAECTYAKDTVDDLIEGYESFRYMEREDGPHPDDPV